MSISQEQGPGQAPTGVEPTHDGSEHKNHPIIPDQRGQDKLPAGKEKRRLGRLGKRIVAGSLIFSGLAAGGSAAYAAGKGPTRVAGTPVPIEAPRVPGNPGADTEAKAPTETATEAPAPEGEALTPEEAWQNFESIYVTAEPQAVELGANGIPSQGEFGSVVTTDVSARQEIANKLMHAFSVADSRAFRQVATDVKGEFKTSSVETLSTGMDADELAKAFRNKAMTAAYSHPELLTPDNQIKTGGFVYRFEDNGGEVNAHSTHPNNDIYTLPGNIILGYKMVDPENPLADENGIVTVDLGPKQPDGTNAPLVAGKNLGIMTFKNGDLGGQAYIRWDESALEPGS